MGKEFDYTDVVSSVFKGKFCFTDYDRIHLAYVVQMHCDQLTDFHWKCMLMQALLYTRLFNPIT